VKRLQEATRLRRRVGTLIVGSTVLPQIGPENRPSCVGIDVHRAINSSQSTRSEGLREFCETQSCFVVPFRALGSISNGHPASEFVKVQ
jgi:hypothetical protein